MEKLVLFGLIIAIGFAGITLSGWVIMALWNFLFPGLFGLPLITFWQGFAFALLLSVISSFFKK
jgi:hypothetical protein